jgi:hypothetical protein
MKGTRNEKLEDEEKKRKKTVITVCWSWNWNEWNRISQALWQGWYHLLREKSSVLLITGEEYTLYRVYNTGLHTSVPSMLHTHARTRQCPH